jgi:hypothetical protein
MNVSAVLVDGKKFAAANKAVVLPTKAREVQIEWQKKTDFPALSYDNAVRDYQAEYRRRYDQWLQTGKN